MSTTPRQRIARSLSLAGFASGGLLLAHAITYVMVVPSGIHRHALLVRTGHGYLSFAVSFAAVAAAVAAVVTIAAGYHRSRTRKPAPDLGPSAARLVGVQTVAFVVLEVLERILAGAPIADLAGPVLVVGLAIQVLVGVLGAVLVVCLDRVGATLTAPRRQRPMAPTHIHAPVAPEPIRSRPWRRQASRAPPALLGHAE